MHLGWDTEAAELMRRAAAIIEQVGMSAHVASSFGVVGRCQTGSAADVLWDSPASMQEAKSRIRAANVMHTDKAVWLDRKKTGEEMRPARVIRRAAEYCDQVELGKADPQSVLKKVGSKIIEVGGTRACFALKGELRPTLYAALRYSAGEIRAIRVRRKRLGRTAGSMRCHLEGRHQRCPKKTQVIAALESTGPQWGALFASECDGLRQQGHSSGLTRHGQAWH